MTANQLRNYAGVDGTSISVPCHVPVVVFNAHGNPTSAAVSIGDPRDGRIVYHANPLQEPEVETERLEAKIHEQVLEDWVETQYGPWPLVSATDDELASLIADAPDIHFTRATGPKLWLDNDLRRRLVLGQLARDEFGLRRGESNHARLARSGLAHRTTDAW
jgi:hypothetical protein